MECSDKDTYVSPIIHFEVLGEPQALKRHRVFRVRKNNHEEYDPITLRKRKHIVAYDPNKDSKESFLAVAHRHAPDVPLDCPLRLILSFYFKRPKSHYRGGKHAGQLKPSVPTYHIGRPDTDNLIKFVADGLNGIFWRDDSLLCEVFASKKYSERPRTIVQIVPIKPTQGVEYYD